jgi:hypothetical protein
MIFIKGAVTKSKGATMLKELPDTTEYDAPRTKWY